MLNLDGMDPDELAAAANALAALSRYAQLKSSAMKARARGSISVALKFESRCEALYNSLGAEYKW